MQAPLQPKATDQLQRSGQHQQKFHTFLMNKSAQYKSFFFFFKGGGRAGECKPTHSLFYTSQSQKKVH